MLVVPVIVAVVVVVAMIVDVVTIDDATVAAGTVAIIVGTAVVLSSLVSAEHAVRSRPNARPIKRKWRNFINFIMCENLFYTASEMTDSFLGWTK